MARTPAAKTQLHQLLHEIASINAGLWADVKATERDQGQHSEQAFLARARWATINDVLCAWQTISNETPYDLAQRMEIPE